MRPTISLWLLGMLLLIGCQPERTYTLEELRTNHYNQLNIPVKSALEVEGFDAIFKTYQDLDPSALEEQLTTTSLELHETSFGLYYLANAHAKENDLRQAVDYHLAAANHYLNPLSFLKLAEREFFAQKDYTKAYFYLHHALEILVEITGNNRSHPLSRNTKDKAQYLLQELERMGDQGIFDKATTRKQLKVVLPAITQQYRQLYGLDEVPSS